MSKTGNHREDAPETGDYLVTLCAFLSVGKLDKAGRANPILGEIGKRS
jgi:hypothetical protein